MCVNRIKSSLRSYFWQAVYPGRVRVARFKWTGAHVCILGCTWVGWVSGGGGMAEMDRCLEHESRCYVTGRAREGGEEGLDFCTRQIEI